MLRREFINLCTRALRAQGLHVLAGECQAPPEEELAAVGANRYRGLQLVHREVSRVLADVADRQPVEPPPRSRKPRTPAGCLY